MDARRRSRLAPLDADQFLRWAWNQGDREKGTHPLTVDDLWFELSAGGEFSREDVRRWFVHLAAVVRRNQRIGADPWECVGWRVGDVRAFVKAQRGDR